MHFTSTSQFREKIELERLFRVADSMRKPHVKGIDLVYQARGKMMAIVTDKKDSLVSFEVAMKRLGGEVIVLGNDQSLEDTIQMANEYAEVIVLNHSHKDAVQIATEASRVPVINGGEGNGENPVQALSDVYSILKEFGEVDNINIEMVGNLAMGVVRSLIHLLGFYEDVKIKFTPQSNFGLLAADCELLDSLGIHHFVGKEPDVMYITRLCGLTDFFIDEYLLGKNLPESSIKEFDIRSISPNTIVLHSQFRSEDLPLVLRKDPRCAIWRQVRSGIRVRTALLYNLFNHNKYTVA